MNDTTEVLTNTAAATHLRTLLGRLNNEHPDQEDRGETTPSLTDHHDHPQESP